MSGYTFFIPEFVLCTNSSLFWFKIANELSEFRNHLILNLNFYNIITFKVIKGKAIKIVKKIPW